MSVNPDEYSYVDSAARNVISNEKYNDTKIRFRRCVMVSNSNHNALATLIRARYTNVRVDVHVGLMWDYVCVSYMKAK